MQSNEPPKIAYLPPTKHPSFSSSLNGQKYSGERDTDEIRAKTSERNDSENVYVDDKITHFSSSLEDPQQNDIDWALCQQYGTAEPKVTEIKGETTKEKVIEKTEIELVVVNRPNISGIHDNNTLLGLNSGTSGELENSNIAVTILTMIYGRPSEFPVSRSFHHRALFVFFVIVFVIVSLALIISQTTT